MIYYNYDSKTKEFLGSNVARPNPKEAGEFLLPANATFTAPTEEPDTNEINVWNGSAWEIKVDYRGYIVYNLDSDNIIIV